MTRTARKPAPGRITDFGDLLFADIPWWPGYRVTDDGRVWTSKLGADGGWRPMKTRPGSTGYPRVMLSHMNRQKEFMVHELMMAAFRGPRPDGAQVIRHLNGDPTDNRLANLEWGTYADNERDKFEHGRRPQGEQVYGAKLTAEGVAAIRRRHSRGERTADLMREFGIDKSTICRVLRRSTWRHIA